MNYLRKLVGQKCYLSPLNSSQSEKVAKWSNDMEVAIRTGDISDMITNEIQRGYLENMNNSSGYAFYIIREEDNEVVGIGRLMRVNFINRNAIMGMFIGEKNNRNNGIGTEATKLLLDFGFNILNLRNIMIETYSFNEPAIKVLKKCGFKEIGRRRKSIIYGNNEYDEVLMDMLNEEFQDSIIDKVLNVKRGD
ncbi:GNAT family N-acetyltransferase [Clostridium sp. YIM B02515]|uniref:GNAT family N-acetyltransferase n=1 Tax=Clostridium rhizosphaerae TaxID=2803861 RepID=A0ABS1TI97_9CLOT|nr:GNAT family protein [Clostridium rhizosphaerae]MBL4938512.1 GNAT family N-acetyltransferase [Clostridium rhizosphaerae]